MDKFLDLVFFLDRTLFMKSISCRIAIYKAINVSEKNCLLLPNIIRTPTLGLIFCEKSAYYIRKITVSIFEGHSTTLFRKSIPLGRKRDFYWIYQLNNNFWTFYFYKKVFTISKPAGLFIYTLPVWRKKWTPFVKIKCLRHIV